MFRAVTKTSFMLRSSAASKLVGLETIARPIVTQSSFVEQIQAKLRHYQYSQTSLTQICKPSFRIPYSARLFGTNNNFGDLNTRFITNHHSPERITPEQDEPAPKNVPPVVVYQHSQRWKYRLASTVGTLQILMCTAGLYRAYLYPDLSYGMQIVGLTFAGALMYLSYKHGRSFVNRIGVFPDYPRAPVIISAYSMFGGDVTFQVPRSSITGVPPNYDLANVKALPYLPLFINGKAPFRLPKAGKFHRSNLFFNVMGYTIPDLVRCPPSVPSLLDLKVKAPAEFERIMEDGKQLAKMAYERQQQLKQQEQQQGSSNTESKQ